MMTAGDRAEGQAVRERVMQAGRQAGVAYAGKVTQEAGGIWGTGRHRVNKEYREIAWRKKPLVSKLECPREPLPLKQSEQSGDEWRDCRGSYTIWLMG